MSFHGTPTSWSSAAPSPVPATGRPWIEPPASRTPEAPLGYVEEYRRAKDAIIQLGGTAFTLIIAIGVGALFAETIKVHESTQKQISLAIGLIGFCAYYVLRILDYRRALLHCARKLKSLGFAERDDLSALSMSSDDIVRFTTLIVVVPVVIIVVIGASLIVD